MGRRKEEKAWNTGTKSEIMVVGNTTLARALALNKRHIQDGKGLYTIEYWG